MAWATTLHSLLTQLEQQDMNNSLKYKMLLIILPIDQSEEQGGEDRED